jgi:hypothetical protein
MRYLLGARGESLTHGLRHPVDSSRELAQRLQHSDREVRARHLAAELARWVRALRARELA